jgi:UDP-N-acetyl-D-glucosamine dehydrogenase
MLDQATSQLRDQLLHRIESREAVVGIVGLGYVGLPLLVAFSKAGFSLLGFDIDQDKVDLLQAGKSYLKGIEPVLIREMLEAGRFDATTDISRAAEADALVICVPTPLNAYREPDMRFVVSTAEALAPHLRRGQIVSFESTTYPGTSQELIIPILEKFGLNCDRDFFFVYSPEREDPGNPDYVTATIPKIIGASSQAAMAVGKALYEGAIEKLVPVSNMRTAEAVKLTENVYRAVNIALVNELKVIYEAMDIDVWEVIDAAKTKPFGFTAFYPGPGLGGHCIPIDPFYLTWKAREYGLHTRFIELAGEINRAMPARVVDKVAAALSRHAHKALNGAKILIVGMAYKKNVDDIRESPALEILELLEDAGASVDYYDPYISTIPRTREHASLAGRKSVGWSAATLQGYDAAVISTDHSDLDWQLLGDQMPIVVDTRNVMEGRKGKALVVKA